jgi:hypothetical protein
VLLHGILLKKKPHRIGADAPIPSNAIHLRTPQGAFWLFLVIK